MPKRKVNVWEGKKKWKKKWKKKREADAKNITRILQGIPQKRELISYHEASDDEVIDITIPPKFWQCKKTSETL